MLCGDYDAMPCPQPAPAVTSITWFLLPYLVVVFPKLLLFLVPGFEGFVVLLLHVNCKRCAKMLSLGGWEAHESEKGILAS